MEVAILIVVALAFGMIARFSFPQREEYGLFLTPALSMVIACAVWLLVTLTGWLSADNFFAWLLSLGLGALAAVLVAKFLPAARISDQKELFQDLVAQKN